MQYKCLSIAGFDGSGGAGIQADLKTFSAFGCYGMTVLTALPIQNTCGVRSCYDIPVKSIEEQLEAIFDDIVPNSIKIGMLFSAEIIEVVSAFLLKHAQNIPVVLDPVMVAKSGDLLLKKDAVEALKVKLIPIVTLVTPNLPEAYALTRHIQDMEALASSLLTLGPKAVLLKGGHLKTAGSNDLFMAQNGDKMWLETERIHSKNTHGTGCTLSAAISACLAQGISLIESCQIAKHYLFEALKAAQYNSVGNGYGPVHHFYHIWPTINKIREKYLHEAIA